MKKLLFIFLIISYPLLTEAQTNKVFYKEKASSIVAKSNKVFLKNERVTFVQFNPNESIPVSQANNILNSFIDKSTGGISNFKFLERKTDDLGFTLIKYQQQLNNLLVEDAIYYVHSKNNAIVSVNGDYYNTIKSNSTFNAGVSSTEAIQLAKNYLRDKPYQWDDQIVEAPIQVIVVDDNNVAHTTYKVDLYSHKPLARKYIYVDIHSKKVIKSKQRICHGDEVGSAETRYSGVKQITTDSYNGSYRLRETGRGGGINTYDMNESTNYNDAVDFIDNDNYWDETLNDDDVAFDVHYGAEMTYDFFYNWFGRNSYDDNGAPINSFVHFDVNFDNAFWDGYSMTYGDGDFLNPLTTIDIVGHEITHAVTQHSANLVYQDESGALNESFSDIFGIMIDFESNPSIANYEMGEQVLPDGSPMRSMSNPNSINYPDTYQGNFWVTGPEDNGGVHTNSSVQNYWFYLLAEGGSGTNDNSDDYNVTGIGRAAAAQISYRNLTSYLTPNSNFSDARDYSIQAAIDLFGECSQEVISTTDAWYAVGVGSVYEADIVADFSASKTTTCGFPSIVNFTNLSFNADSYLWDFGDGNTSTAFSPNHTYIQSGSYTVSLTVNGSGACTSSNSSSKIEADYIVVSDNDNSISTQSCIPVTLQPKNSTRGIYNFNFGSINKSSSGGTEGYKDFSCSDQTTLIAGTSYPISITSGSTHQENIKVWIDYNNDGVFDMDSEYIFQGIVTNLNNPTISGDVIIDQAVYNTPLRLRVISEDISNNIVNACSSITYGQAEDYSVIISENLNPPVADFEASKTRISLGETIQFTDLSLNVPTAWEWVFEGASETSSSEKNPSVAYNKIGVFPVSLRSINGYGDNEVLKTAYIEVINSYNLCENNSSSTISGTLFDSGGELDNYSDVESCGFLIAPECVDQIRIDFVSFDVEEDWDYLYIYDGENDQANILLEATGASLPSQITSTGDKLFIKLVTDVYVNTPGFELEWTSITSDGNIYSDLDNDFVVDNCDVCFGDNSTNDNDGDGYCADVDCDDNDETINPGVSEILNDGIDNDCNPLTYDVIEDNDGDGFNNDVDCDDNNADVNPNAVEIPYDGLDNDCNPATLDDDLDEDGFINAIDCDDDNASINPDAVEIPNDGIDNDCDSLTSDNVEVNTCSELFFEDWEDISTTNSNQWSWFNMQDDGPSTDIISWGASRIQSSR